MKKCKFIYKFKKILISIMCIITLFFAMPVKASAGVIESFFDIVCWIPDLIMTGLNGLLGYNDKKTYIDVNYKGLDLNSGTGGRIYNFDVTPADIFRSGMKEKVRYADSVKSKNFEDLVATGETDSEYIFEIVYNQKGDGTLTENGKEIFVVYESKKIQGSPPSYCAYINNEYVIKCLRDSEEYEKLVENHELNESGTHNIIPIEYLIENYEEEMRNYLNDNSDLYLGDEYRESTRTILPLLNVDFFAKNYDDENDSAGILQPVISYVYQSLTKFVIIAMLVVLLYIGIRIIISSAVTEQSKYKQLLVDWCIGLCLVFCMHIIMSFIMSVNQLIVNTLGSTDADNYYISLSSANWDKIFEPSKKKIANFAADKLERIDGLESFSIDKNGCITDSKKFQKELTDKSLTSLPLDARIYKEPSKFTTSKTGEEGDVWADKVIYRCNIVEYIRTCTTVDTDYVAYIKHNGNKTKIEYDGTVKDEESNDEESDDEKIYTGTFYAYILMYIILAIETVIFAIKYIKRVIYLAFLTMIAPLIALMYPMDKVGDGKAQTFNMWFKEYLFNSLLQPLHLLLYTIFIVGATDLAHSHCIYAIGFYAFMLFAEGFFKKMFGFDKANMPKGLGSPLAAGMSMKVFDAITGLGPPGSPGSKKGGGTDSNPGGKIKRAKAKFGTSNSGMPSSSGGSGGSGMPFSSGDSGMPFSSGGSGMPFSSGNSGMPSSSGRIKNGISSALGIGKQAFNRKKSSLVRAITGGKTGNFTNALKGHKLDIAKTVGRTGLKIANRAAGTAAGTLLGLTSGVIGTAVTGDSSYLTKGVTTGAATGFNRSKNIESWMARENEENKKMYASENVAYAAQMSKEQFMKDNYKYFDSLPDSKRQNLLETLETFTPYMDFKDTSQLEAMDAIYQENKGDMSLEDIYNSSQDAKTWGDLTDSSRRSDYEKYIANEERKNIEAKDVTYTKDELDKEIEAQRNAEEERIRSKYEPKIKMKYDIKSDSEAQKLEIAMNKALSDMSKIDFKERAEGEIRNRKIDEISMERARQKSKMTQSYQNKMK